MDRKRGFRLLALAVAWLLPSAGLSLIPAAADPPVVLPPPLVHDGHVLRDHLGREVTLRGLNVVFKKPPYLPDPTGSTITATSLNDADAALIASWGFNVVRLGLIWKAVEPSRGIFDANYVSKATLIAQILATHGIYTLVDFHQDVFNERYAGEGAPDWAVQSPLPPTNTGNWGANYFTPAVMNEYDLFWANAGGVQDRYAAAWAYVAGRMRHTPGVLGYDLFNEPWPGSQWPSCANPAGCPLFDDLVLDAFYAKVAAAIRAADPHHMIYVSPAIPSNFGAATSVGPAHDPPTPSQPTPQIGLSFHVYCLEGSLDGSFSGQGASCETLDARAMQTQAAWARSTGAHPLLSEFGATDVLATIDHIEDLAQSNGVASWIYWAYKQFDDPTGSPTESVLDPATQAPKTAKLATIARPYARAVAGTNVAQNFAADPMLRTLHVEYEAFAGTTEIVWPTALLGPYAANAVCTVPAACSLSAAGDRIFVHTSAPTSVIVAVSKLGP